jgi:hypothetical protein
MRFTFNSESYGTTVEINFEATHIDQIRDMFNQFLRGSGFHFEDEDENCVQISDTDNELDLPITPDDLLRQSEREGWRQVGELQKELQQMENSTEYRLGLLMQAPDYKPKWVGLTGQEIATYSTMFNGVRLIKAIEALLRERNT